VADERPEVPAVGDRPIVIPSPADGSGRAHEDVVTVVAKEYTAVELLYAVDRMSFDTSVALTAVMEKLGSRKQDIDELLTLTKTAYELSRKVRRLGDRILGESRDAT
jgi:hypothetical protein